MIMSKVCWRRIIEQKCYGVSTETSEESSILNLAGRNSFYQFCHANYKRGGFGSL